MATLPQWIEARVIQKIATEAEWNEITLVPYKGEVCLVGDSGGKVVNIKIGDGINTFPNLNYMFDSIQKNVGYIAIESNALPTPEGDVAWGMVTGGTYTFGGSDAFTVPTGHWGIANYSSGAWSLVDMGELPSPDLSKLVSKDSMTTSQNLFSEGMLVGLSFSSNGLINATSEAKSFYIEGKTGDSYVLERDVAKTNRFQYGFTETVPVQDTPITGLTNTSTTKYDNIVFPFDGYLVVYLSSSTDVNPDFSNIELKKVLTGSDLALNSDVQDIKKAMPKPLNLFKESLLVGMSMSSNGLVNISPNARSFYYPVSSGDKLKLYRDAATSNRFQYGFTSVPPVQDTPLVGITTGSTTSYDIEAPIDGYLFVYLSNSTDIDPDYSNIVLSNNSILQVVDSLDSELVDYPLSARQGKVLNDKINNFSSSPLFMFGKFNEIFRTGSMPDLSSVLPSMTAVDLYDLIDTAVADNPRGITKRLLGYGADSNNAPDTNAPIYEYELLPTMARPGWDDLNQYLESPPVILILAGLHGNEKMPPYAVYDFIKRLSLSNQDEVIASIRDNCIVRIVPIGSPWCFDNHSRENINGVNLNRDFNSPTPQQETIVLKDWISDNDTASVYIDFHNSYYQESGVSYTICDSIRQSYVFSSLTRRLSPLWKAKFPPGSGNNDNYTRGFVKKFATMEYGGLSSYYAYNTVGIDRSAVVEACKNWYGNINNWYTAEVTEVNTEIIINYVLATLGSMNK